MSVLDESLKLLESQGVATEGLREAYQEPHRRYHNLDHIQNLILSISELHKFYALPPHFVVDLHTIAWYHDVVYDPTTPRGSNEMASGERYLHENMVLPDNNPVYHTIVGTITHQNPDSFIAAMFYDMDLAGLGAEWGTYSRNSLNVRAEYHTIDNTLWRAGRQSFLVNMLSRPSIFHTSWGCQFEARARQNMYDELRDVTGVR